MQGHVVSLQGRLGNQLFQYAFARWLERETQQPVRFDLSLVGVNAVAEVLRKEVVERRVRGSQYLPAPFGRYGTLGRGARRFVGPRRLVLDASAQGGRPASLVLRDAWWTGYWQRHDYATAALDEIREALGCDPADGQEAIGIHVRRGDYADLGASQGARWYRRAVQRALAHSPGLPVFVVSDDPDWCRTHLDVGTRWSSLSTSSAENDLRTLASSSVLIASSSSFSYWAALLGDCFTISPPGPLPAPLWAAIGAVELTADGG